MPQSLSPASPASARSPIRLAQNETGSAGPSVAGTHAGTVAEGSHEKQHSPGDLPDPVLLFMNSLVVVAILVGFALAVRRRRDAVPTGLQNFGEWVAESLNNFTVGMIGPGGEKYTPLTGTIFLYVLLSNLLGLIPGFHSPTANLSTTLALGFVVFVYVQYQGIRHNGLGGYLKHFAGGEGIPVFIVPLLFVIEVISEFIKPFTLAIRLFGNIFGEDVIILVLAGLGGALGGALFGWLPIQLPLMLLALLTAFVQAMVFMILTCIYIVTMTEHGDEEEHGGEAAPGAPHAPGAGH
jgi:F-type H+-transporting ATPase subunit a